MFCFASTVKTARAETRAAGTGTKAATAFLKPRPAALAGAAMERDENALTSAMFRVAMDVALLRVDKMRVW